MISFFRKGLFFSDLKRVGSDCFLIIEVGWILGSFGENQSQRSDIKLLILFFIYKLLRGLYEVDYLWARSGHVKFLI